MTRNAVFNWSGGKDSAFALNKVLSEQDFNIKTLLTTVNHEAKRISMHGVREELLEKQANGIGIPLTKLELPSKLDMESYDRVMKSQLEKLIADHNITHSIFGDIFLEDLREYRDNKSKELNLQTVYPIWKNATSELAKAFIESGFKTIIVCTNAAYLGKEFVGRTFDHDFLNDLPDNVDPCGENGEFHTFCYAGPIYKEEISFEVGEKVFKPLEVTISKDDDSYAGHSSGPSTPGFWYCDIY